MRTRIVVMAYLGGVAVEWGIWAAIYSRPWIDVNRILVVLSVQGSIRCMRKFFLPQATSIRKFASIALAK